MDDSEQNFIRRQTSAKLLGTYMPRMLDPVARARGFATTTLLSEWPSIVGSELAAFTQPDKIVWPRRPPEDAPAPPKQRRGEGALLVLRVDGPRAVEVQHAAGPIVERVNTYFGYRAIASLRILQAPVKRSVSPEHPALIEPDPAVLPKATTLKDGPLKTALMRLGAGAKGKAKRR